jgi:RNA polymerase sigma-B factor
MGGGRDGLDEALAAYRESGKEEELREVMRAGKRLVCYYVKLFSAGSLDEDMVQAGYEGLLKAVKKFEEGAGAGFVTYASHCIMGEIRHYIRKETSYYRPGCVADLQYKVEKMVEERLKESGELPKIEEIAKKLNVKEEGVKAVMRAGLVPLEKKEIKILKYESFRLPIEDKILLEQAMNKLGNLQKRVINMLFFRDMTQVEAAEELGVNQRKVSRELHKGLKSMARYMEEN